MSPDLDKADLTIGYPGLPERNRSSGLGLNCRSRLFAQREVLDKQCDAPGPFVVFEVPKDRLQI